jgi:sirohydrochlorin ferrochelatase
MDLPVLVGCGHGTRSPAGRRALARLRLDVAAARPGLRVVAACADTAVQRPGVAAVVGRLTAAGTPCIVVPLLLSTGYHVEVDVGSVVAGSGGLAVAARPLGPDDALAAVLDERLAACGAAPSAVVVLAAVGSRRAQARQDVQRTAAMLATRRGGPVEVGYLAGQPPLAEVVAAARAGHPGREVAIATYLLAPSELGPRLRHAGADHVAEPLAPHPALTGLTLRRYDEARYSAHA